MLVLLSPKQKPSVTTPWGQADYAREIAPGIVFYGTPSHGGFHLDRDRQKNMPKGLKRSEPWYEEDCDYNRVILAFPGCFSPEQVTSARAAMKSWFPDDYTKWCGEAVTAAESHVVRDREFRKTNVNNYVVTAAWGSWHKDVPKGFVGVFAVRGGRLENGQYATDDHKYFMVPEAEYQARNNDFVIDLSRHPEASKF